MASRDSERRASWRILVDRRSRRGRRRDALPDRVQLENLGEAVGSSHAFVACSSLTLDDEAVRVVTPGDLPRLATAMKTLLLVLRKDVWP